MSIRALLLAAAPALALSLAALSPALADARSSDSELSADAGKGRVPHWGSRYDADFFRNAEAGDEADVEIDLGGLGDLDYVLRLGQDDDDLDDALGCQRERRDGHHGRMFEHRVKPRDMMGRERAGRRHEMMRGQRGFPTLLSLDQVRDRLARKIAGNKRLKVASVEPGGDFTAKADITTLEGSLVHRLLIDRRDGTAWEVE
jgi:hypothetical protein